MVWTDGSVCACAWTCAGPTCLQPLLPLRGPGHRGRAGHPPHGVLRDVGHPGGGVLPVRGGHRRGAHHALGAVPADPATVRRPATRRTNPLGRLLCRGGGGRRDRGGAPDQPGQRGRRSVAALAWGAAGRGRGGGAWGIAIGYWASPRAAIALATLAWLLLAYLGGLWETPAELPSWAAEVSSYLPTRLWGEVTWAGGAGPDLVAPGLAGPAGLRRGVHGPGRAGLPARRGRQLPLRPTQAIRHWS